MIILNYFIFCRMGDKYVIYRFNVLNKLIRNEIFNTNLIGPKVQLTQIYTHKAILFS